MESEGSENIRELLGDWWRRCTSVINTDRFCSIAQGVGAWNRRCNMEGKYSYSSLDMAIVLHSVFGKEKGRDTSLNWVERSDFEPRVSAQKTI